MCVMLSMGSSTADHPSDLHSALHQRLRERRPRSNPRTVPHEDEGDDGHDGREATEQRRSPARVLKIKGVASAEDADHVEKDREHEREHGTPSKE